MTRMIIVFAVAAVSVLGAVGGQRVVAVDQLGYAPAMQKYIFSTAAADSFSVVLMPAGSTVYRGPMSLWQSWDDATGRPVFRGDFSNVQVAGSYCIITSHGDTSAPFAISDSVYDAAFRKALRGFYYQRCGMQLLPSFAGIYQHGACHGIDGIFHTSSDSAGRFHLATGGWHDAGDYGKYVVNAGISTGTLLLAWEMFPGQFGADDLGIPESGNGVPDILDEARYEISWFLRMQRADGAFWFKLTPKQFEGFIMPQADNSSRYIYQVSTAATGDAVAVLARAARLYAPYDAAFATSCLNAAKRGWQFLSANLSIIPAGGFRNPSDTYTGEYGDGDDTDERLWAAAELFETTGDSAYNAAFLSQYVFGPVFSSPMSWPDVSALGLLTYLRSKQPAADAAARTELRTALLGFCASQTTKRNGSGYEVLLAPGDYVWGSNSVALNAAILLIAGYAENGNTAFVDVAADQLHYVLGVNGLARCYVTGLGENPPRQPHHRPSASDAVAAPVPGLLAGGANQYGSDPVLMLLLNASTPPGLCYADTIASYGSNEIAINWNAPLVFVSGFFRGGWGTSSVGEATPGNPHDFFLGQNYPNPFNSSTTIAYTVGGVRGQGSGVSLVRLAVYDILGREVAVLVNEKNTLGRYEVEFNAEGLSSGMYFYRLQAGSFVETKKLLLLR